MSEERQNGAGAFDVRNVIAALIGAYGVVLVVMGVVGGDGQLEKTGGVNANLWAGIVMAAVALAFAVWSRVRPVVVEESPDEAPAAAPHEEAAEPAAR